VDHGGDEDGTGRTAAAAAAAEGLAPARSAAVEARGRLEPARAWGGSARRVEATPLRNILCIRGGLTL